MSEHGKLLDNRIPAKFKYIELVALVGFIISTALSFIQYQQVPMRLDYIPSAVTGFPTLSGILTAFVGFWVSRQGTPADEKTRKWMQEREVTIILIITSGLLLVAGGLSFLGFQSLTFAFPLSILGTLMVI